MPGVLDFSLFKVLCYDLKWKFNSVNSVQVSSTITLIIKL